jgi:hypothetical protein
MQYVHNNKISAGVFLVVLACFSGGCRPSTIAGKYRVEPIGEPGKCLFLDEGGGGPVRVGAKVIAVGWDKQHVIVKQKRNSMVSYFIIEHTRDHGLADTKDVVTGPLNENNYFSERERLNVSSNLVFTVRYY